MAPLRVGDLQQAVDRMSVGLERAWARGHALLQSTQYELGMAEARLATYQPPRPIVVREGSCLLFQRTRWIEGGPDLTPQLRAAVAEWQARERAARARLSKLAALNPWIDRYQHRLAALPEALDRLAPEHESAARHSPEEGDRHVVPLASGAAVSLLYRTYVPGLHKHVEEFSRRWLWRFAFEDAEALMRRFTEDELRKAGALEELEKSDVATLMATRLEHSLFFWTEWEQVALPPCTAAPAHEAVKLLIGTGPIVGEIAARRGMKALDLPALGPHELLLVRASLGLPREALFTAIVEEAAAETPAAR